jgi:thioredoxin-related protein
MKKVILSLLLFAFMVQYNFAQEKSVVKWYTIAEAQILNKKEPRKIMIDVYTDWCGWCKKMDAETFTDPIIANYINTNFYAVKFNAESKDSVVFNGKTFYNKGTGRSTHQFAKALLKNQISYPSIAYLNDDLRLITTMPGYYKPVDLEPLLKYFGTNSFKKQQYEEFQKTFKGSY